MKSTRKFVGALVVAVVLVTTIFSMTTFAMETHCTVTYKVSDNVKNLVKDDVKTEEWIFGGDVDKNPQGCTAEEVPGYEFYRWVEKDKDSLPAGWTYEGRVLSFNKDAEGVTPGSITFVAEYISAELKSGPVLNPDNKETEKIVSVEEKKDTPSVIKDDKIEKTNATVEDETVEAVKTGDTNNLFVWILIGALALVAVIAVVIIMLKGKK